MKSRYFLLAALAASTLAMADPPPGPPPGAREPPIERLAQELNLDPAQQAEMQRILAAHREKSDAELRQQLAAVLTAEQLARFDALRKRGPIRTAPGVGPGTQAQ